MGNTMRGVVFTGDRTLEVREFPIPEPGRGQALIQMRSAAICGSDLHVYRRPKADFAGPEGWIPGHEPAGVVAALGEGTGRVKVGDPVSIYHYLACGHCRWCLSGYMQWCEQRRGLGQPAAQGPDADYMLVDERNCLLLPEALNYEDGALIACIIATGYSSMRKLRPSGADTLIIFGQGPVGLTGTILGKAYGARVIGVDIADERLDLARALGADAVLNPDKVRLVEAVRDLTRGQGADLAFETSGSAAAHQAVLDVLKYGGQGVFVGFGASGPTVNLTSIIGRQLVLMGSFVMPIHYYWDLVDFLLQHDLPKQFARMITHRFPISQAVEAFRVADSARAGKVMFVWD